jgi:hypothetical protein
MSGTTDMNIIIGQGTTIKEVHNVKKQNLEINQQFVAQNSESQKGEEKSKVQEYETNNKIEIKKEEEEDEEKKKKLKKRKKQKHTDEQDNESDMTEGNLIDIRV